MHISLPACVCRVLPQSPQLFVFWQHFPIRKWIFIIPGVEMIFAVGKSESDLTLSRQEDWASEDAVRRPAGQGFPRELWLQPRKGSHQPQLCVFCPITHAVLKKKVFFGGVGGCGKQRRGWNMKLLSSSCFLASFPCSNYHLKNHI